MEWTIPGTSLTGQEEDAAQVEAQFRAMFLGGGITLSQVAAVTGLEPYTIQNWVKRGFLPPPQQKRYTLKQLCRIVNINMLKSILPMDRICGLMAYINGHLDDESDDIIDDSVLYFMFVRLAIHHRTMKDPVSRDECLAREMANYVEPVPGARDRVDKVLRIMLTAWCAARLRSITEGLMEELGV